MTILYVVSFVDFQKAFDNVNHDILLAKLAHFGMRGYIYKWFESYLKDRKQFVSILGYESSKTTLRHGVPQGSRSAGEIAAPNFNQVKYGRKSIKHTYNDLHGIDLQELSFLI